MGLHLPPNATLDTLSIKDIQNTLNAYGQYPRPDRGQDDTKPFTIDTTAWTKETHSQQEEQMTALIDNGLAKRSSDNTKVELTDEGDALRHATLRERAPLEKADKLFEQVKKGVNKLKEEGITQVDEVWIYGSYMRRHPAIGDIDIAAKTSDTIDIRERSKAIHEKCTGEDWYEKASRGGRDPIPAQKYVEARLYGGNTRHEMLKDGQSTLRSLMTMPVPCQQVYTHNEGWDAKEIQERHPQAAKTDPPGRKPRATIKIDQGTFSSYNDGTPPPTREDVIRSKVQAAAQTLEAPRKTAQRQNER